MWVPERYNIMIGIWATKQCVNDLIYFFGNDLVILFLVLTIRTFAKGDKVFSIIVNAALFLAIGKTVDEVFTSPYGYHMAEFIFDALVVGWAITSYIKCRVNTAKNS